MPTSTGRTEEARVMGIDFGGRRTGVALSDPTRTLASPLVTIERRAGKRPPLKELAEIARAHDVACIVVGLPLNPDGEETPWCQEVRGAGDELGRRLGVPVRYVDERFSSVRAERAVRSSGLPRKERERKDRVDRAAAALILQDWLDRGVVGAAPLFRAYVRLRGADREIRSGIYAFRRGERWSTVVDALRQGRVVSVPMTIPEGWTISRMIPRIAAVTQLPEDSVADRLRADSLAERWDVPGPGLEGYLFPDTYRFTPGVPLSSVVRAMTERYRAFWTPARRRRLEERALTEREAVTLASIVQAEARKAEEMPKIAAVYQNRIRRRYPLQADPTVLYALGGPRERLLYAAIDSVADNPYNTYAHPGLPPGPIGAPGEAALAAVLDPADVDFLYFVARPDGTHVFTRTLTEHNRAKAQARRAWDAAESSTVPRPALDSATVEGNGR